MKNKKNFKRIAGLTLLEILVSMVVFALIMGGLANLFISTKRLILRAGYQMSSAEIGKRFLDPLQLKVSADTWNTNCLGQPNYSDCPPDEVFGGITYHPTYQITNLPGTNLQKVVVTVDKEGSTIGGLLDCLGILTSMCLQHGIPLKDISKKMMGQTFSPQGFCGEPGMGFAKSIPDFVFRWLMIFVV